MSDKRVRIRIRADKHQAEIFGISAGYAGGTGCALFGIPGLIIGVLGAGIFTRFLTGKPTDDSATLDIYDSTHKSEYFPSMGQLVEHHNREEAQKERSTMYWRQRYEAKKHKRTTASQQPDSEEA